MIRLEISKASHPQRGELFAQFTIGRWWFGTALPCVSRSPQGNQLHRWALWLRLPGNRELEWLGKPLPEVDRSEDQQ